MLPSAYARPALTYTQKIRFAALNVPNPKRYQCSRGLVELEREVEEGAEVRES